jgi:tRNA threonylcarbamoyladenosine biosynthesis protein TsaE
LQSEIITNSSSQTQKLGQLLGSLLKGGEIIGFEGELGAGKTCFIQGLAKGLGITEDQYVRSPTFTLINEYKGNIPLYHFDLYRLCNVDEIIALGYEEYFNGHGVCAIEWADKLGPIRPARMINVSLMITGPNSRSLHFSCLCHDYQEILKRFFKKADDQ